MWSMYRPPLIDNSVITNSKFGNSLSISKNWENEVRIRYTIRQRHLFAPIVDTDLIKI